MRGPFFHGVGGVLSADIAVPDRERELDFYSMVLTTGRTPLWQDDLTNNQGTPIIGLGARSPEYESLPLQWMPHFQVSDIAASARQALALGGRELMHGKDDDGRSLWAGLVDPAGAAFGLIPVVADESNGASDTGRIGCISWLSLVVPEVSSACEFYEQVVGWSAAPAAIEGRREMRRPGSAAAVAEVCRVDGESEGIPSVWLLSLPVDDLTRSLEHVREGGGEIVGEVPGVGHAIIRDPVGVYLALTHVRAHP